MKLQIMKTFFKLKRTKTVGVTISTILLTIVVLYERDFCNKNECPFHHLKSNLVKPLFKLYCPDTSIGSQFNRQHDENAPCFNLPSIIMLNARPIEDRLISSLSWEGQDLLLVNTTNLGRSNLGCADSSWSTILFQIYLEIFDTVLKRFPEQEDFIFLEDDAELLDKDQMQVETCLAREKGFQFYSLYLTEEQGDSCLYQRGTVAFYVNRRFIKTLLEDVKVHNKFCYIPIDMYIAMHGPWYSTRYNIIKHNSTRFAKESG